MAQATESFKKALEDMELILEAWDDLHDTERIRLRDFFQGRINAVKTALGSVAAGNLVQFLPRAAALRTKLYGKHAFDVISNMDGLISALVSGLVAESKRPSETQVCSSSPRHSCLGG